jgi:hypothetical protein
MEGFTHGKCLTTEKANEPATRLARLHLVDVIYIQLTGNKKKKEDGGFGYHDTNPRQVRISVFIRPRRVSAYTWLLRV